jgi:hypothetical protein
MARSDYAAEIARNMDRLSAGLQRAEAAAAS